jgi:ABC-type Zn uptake system ZnuABC Zn-binding protein ZnuA
VGTSEKLNIVATTTIVGDVVSQVAGQTAEVSVLLPPGTDPHTYEPTPKDLVNIADADVIFASGLGLEAFLDSMIENADAGDKVVYISRGIELLHPIDGFEEQHEGESGAQLAGDPHVWTDPNNVKIWASNISAKLSELDPQSAEIYQNNAQTYVLQLETLDAWIRNQVAQIPVGDREIVTDHVIFTYFADRYGFTQVGAIVSGYSTLAEPSARELAFLEDSIRELDVKAVFVGNTVNPVLAERLAADTGTQLVFVYTGSLTEQGAEADSYLDYIRYNVSAIVDALK